MSRPIPGYVAYILVVGPTPGDRVTAVTVKTKHDCRTSYFRT